MKIVKLESFLAAAALFILAMGCSSDKNAEEGSVANQDIANAIELTSPETKIAKANTGYGNVLEISSDNPADAMYFAKEENSEWYYFKATATGRLGLVVKPDSAGSDFNLMLFKKTGSEFAKEVVERHIMPLRSNMAKASGGGNYDSTGLSCDGQSEFEGAEATTAYSKTLDVDKDSVYYLCVNHSQAGGAGYTIRIFYCGDANGGGTPVDTAQAPPVTELEPMPTLPAKAAPEAAEQPKNVTHHREADNLGPDEEYYYVKPKNTVYSISTDRNETVFELLSRNGLSNNNIFIGQRLIVRKKGAARPQVAVTEPTQKAVSNKPEPEPVKPADPTPEPVKSEPIKPEEISAINSQTIKPIESGLPAPPNSIQATNAVPENVQKLWVYVNVVNVKNNNPVNTIVQVVDGTNTKRVDRIPSNQKTYVPIYAEGQRKKIFVIDAFSFRKETFELDLDNLRNDSSATQMTIVGDTVMLNFELERYRKGDIFAAYNIFFYDDASVMLPKSKYELESLLEMLKENPKVKIRIHGHTNTNKMGKIISLEPNDHDFFRLTAKNKEGFGTAVQLSKRRAESVMYYLTYNGVKAPRMEVRGHGGKNMIYEGDVALAHKNKRVEIEILDE